MTYIMSKEHIIKLDEFWPYQVTVLANLIARNTTAILKAHGEMNLSQWRVLAAVAEKEGRTAAQVVAVTPMDKGIVSRATASLVANGILEKTDDQDDKRRSRLFVTKRGKSIYRRIAKDLGAQTSSVEVSKKLNDHLLDVIKVMNGTNDRR